MESRDLREYIEKIRQIGELKEFSKVDAHLEMGALTEVIYQNTKGPSPAILFDEIKGYPKGYRTIFGLFSSFKRLALLFGIEEAKNEMELVRRLRDKLKGNTPIRPEFIKSSPLEENIHAGKDINLLEFPSPFHHESDGGRYFGTACCVITKDPEEGWVNLGAYRVMLHDKDTLGIHMFPGKHGYIHMEKYFAQNKPCPMAIVLGCDPLLMLMSGFEVPIGVSEYDYTGGLKGKPLQVITGEFTKLPLPAISEIVVEGECVPGKLMDEGPFGESSGYYANKGLLPVKEPVFVAKRIMHRNRPIMTCNQPSKPPDEFNLNRCFIRAALIWDQLEAAGVPEVRGVWCHPAGCSRFFTIVSIKQNYAGHSRQVGRIASQCAAAACVGRYVVVVDEDIDPTNTDEVLWAISTRTDPEQSIEILKRCWSNSSDPMLPPAESPQKGSFNTRAIIDACRPYEWFETFPPVVQSSSSLKDNIIAKFGRDRLGI